MQRPALQALRFEPHGGEASPRCSQPSQLRFPGTLAAHGVRVTASCPRSPRCAPAQPSCSLPVASCSRVVHPPLRARPLPRRALLEVLRGLVGSRAPRRVRVRRGRSLPGHRPDCCCERVHLARLRLHLARTEGSAARRLGGATEKDDKKSAKHWHAAKTHARTVHARMWCRDQGRRTLHTHANTHAHTRQGRKARLQARTLYRLFTQVLLHGLLRQVVFVEPSQLCESGRAKYTHCKITRHIQPQAASGNNDTKPANRTTLLKEALLSARAATCINTYRRTWLHIYAVLFGLGRRVWSGGTEAARSAAQWRGCAQCKPRPTSDLRQKRGGYNVVCVFCAHTSSKRTHAPDTRMRLQPTHRRRKVLLRKPACCRACARSFFGSARLRSRRRPWPETNVCRRRAASLATLPGGSGCTGWLVAPFP